MSEDANQEILTELRKLRQINQCMSYFCLILVGAAVVFLIVEHYKHQQNQQEYPWSKVDVAWGELDYPKALSLAQNILSQDTNNAWGHEYLGNIYFRMGDITNAEAAYKQAYQLFPSKTYEDDITVIQKRIAMENSKTLESK